MSNLPIIWVLKSFRAGDNAQALALARRVGGEVVERQMVFNHLSKLPNYLNHSSIHMLTNESKYLLQQPWPDLVIATGRRTAAVALWIKKQSSEKTKIVQLGRPRLPLRLFDLVISTPQYGLPADVNVVQLPLPFVSARKVPQESSATPWQHLPRPWLVAVVGGQKFPLRLGVAELSGFGEAVERLAKQKCASIVLMSSPRSPENALSVVAEKIIQPKWSPSPGQPNVYPSALVSGEIFCVTSDSVSMVAEMLGTSKPVHVYLLPETVFMPHWKAEKGVRASLARRGILSPPRNTAGMMRQLVDEKFVGDLASGSVPASSLSVAEQQEKAIQRVRLLVGL